MQFDFLICSERSGSNLITKILDGHSAVCGPFPTHMMRTFCPHYYRYGDLAVDQNWTDITQDAAEYLSNIFAQWESTVLANELRTMCPGRTLTDIIRYVYEKEAKTRGKKRVFVKENHAYQFITFTLANFTECRFVWVVRDPRDMALCQCDSVLPGGTQTAVDAWKNDQSESLKVYGYLKDKGNILLVKFEDLIKRSEETVYQVCEFLELPYEPGMLEFYKNANVTKNARAVTAWADLAKPIIADNFNNYKTGLSETQIRFVEAYCHKEMESLGYELDYTPVGDVGELRREMPDESMFDRSYNDSEMERFDPYFDMMNRLQERYASKSTQIG